MGANFTSLLYLRAQARYGLRDFAACTADCKELLRINEKDAQAHELLMHAKSCDPYDTITRKSFLELKDEVVTSCAKRCSSEPPNISRTCEPFEAKALEDP